MLRLARRSFVVFCLAVPAVPVVAGAQQQEGFKNLQVLPKDMARPELLNVMRRFTSSLGLRCNDCHVVKNPGQMPEQLDAAADDKELKKIARQMLQMTMDINGKYLAQTGRTFTARTRVGCETCHRGASKPRTLAAEVLGALEAKDADSAIVRYRELRDKAFGKAQFDFSEDGLPRLADEMSRARRVDDAIKLLNLNLEYFPKSGVTYSQLALGPAQKGDTAAALAAIDKGLQVAPDHPQLKRAQAMLKGQRPQ
ncbi:MAG TPA: c-type cytochrome [Gemmatimonadaceae bacterium]|nr:c-type cytochrome [Gemmatimonadaceae bacterium]